MKKKIEVRLIRTVSIEVDDAKFDEAFMEEFRKSFFPFKSLDDHLRHLACIVADRSYGTEPKEFIEGYGTLEEMGISGRILDEDVEVDELTDMMVEYNHDR